MTTRISSTGTQDTQDRVAKCPTCGEPALGRSNEGFPFCSSRCAMVDLGKWVSGDFLINSNQPIPSTEALRQARKENH